MEGQDESIPFDEFLEFKLKYVDQVYVYTNDFGEDPNSWVFRINKHK